MKNLILILSMGLFLFSACTIKDAYLLHADLDAPLVQPPLHLAGSNANESLNLNINVSGLSKKNVEGIVSKYQQNKITDSLYNGNNLNWKVAPYIIELNLDVKLSRVIYLFGGLNYAGNDNSDGIGGNFGLGFAGGDSINHFRFDIGANFQSTYYSTFYYADAEFLPYNLDFSFVALEEKTRTNVNPFVSLTYNNSSSDWFANPFIQISYLQQNHFKVKAGSGFALNEVYIESDVSLLNLKPGVSFSLGENYFLSAGTSMQYLMGVQKASKEFFITPFAQINFIF